MAEWGLIVFVLSLIGYFVFRKRSDGFAKFLLWLSGGAFGFAVGVLVFYFYAVNSIDRIFGF